MRTVYQQNKWQIFRQIESLPRKSKKRSKLLKQFNNMIKTHTKIKMYEEDDSFCKKCGSHKIKRIQAGDEYHDICECGFEQGL